MNFVLLEDGKVVYEGDADPRAPVVPPAPPPAPEPPKAYDHPVLTAAEAIVDGKTFNKDGSIWGLSPGASPGPVDGMGPVQALFGYISPVKTPEIWAWAKEHLTADQFQGFDARWKQNPYGVYRADPRAIIAAHEMDFVLFGYLVQPSTTYVQ